MTTPSTDHRTAQDAAGTDGLRLTTSASPSVTATPPSPLSTTSN